MARRTRRKSLQVLVRIWCCLLVIFDGLGMPPSVQAIENSRNPEEEHFGFKSMETPREEKERLAMLTNPLRIESPVKEPVLFEPVKPIKLSLSSYQVSSLFSFGPYIESVAKLKQYAFALTDDLLETIQEFGADTSVRKHDMFQQFGAEKAALESQIRLILETEHELNTVLDLLRNPTDTPPSQGGPGTPSPTPRDGPSPEAICGAEASACLRSSCEDQAFEMGSRNECLRKFARCYAPLLEEGANISDCARQYDLWLLSSNICSQRKIVEPTGPDGREAFAACVDSFRPGRRTTRSVPASPPLDMSDPDYYVKMYQALAAICQEPDDIMWEDRPDICEKEFGMNRTDVFRPFRKKRGIGLLLGLFGLGGLFGAASSAVFTKKALDKMRKRIDLVEGRVHENRDDIMRNYQMINLTRMELGEHRRLLMKLDQLTIGMNHTLTHLQSYVGITVKLSTTIQGIKSRLTVLASASDTIRHDLAILFKYMDTLTSQKVSPTLISPVDLRDILLAAQEDIRSHPRLALPSDPTESLWAYYSYLKVVPVVIEDYLVVVLQIPLVDISTTFDVYRVYSLPALHPELQISYTYQLESKYLVVSNDQQFFMLPDEMDVMACMMTEGHWCKLHTAMYPVKSVNWCIASLFKNDPQEIETNCRVKVQKQNNNMAFHVDNNLWAISAMATSKLRIRCLTEDTWIDVKPPFHLVQIPNGCEATADNLWIPPSSMIRAQSANSAGITLRFMGFDEDYVPLTKLHAYNGFKPEELTSEERAKRRTILTQHDTVPMSTMMATYQDPSSRKNAKTSPLVPLVTAGMSSLLFVVVVGMAVLLIRRKMNRARETRTRGGKRLIYHPAYADKTLRRTPKRYNVRFQNATPGSQATASLESEVTSAESQDETTPRGRIVPERIHGKTRVKGLLSDVQAHLDDAAQLREEAVECARQARLSKETAVQKAMEVHQLSAHKN